MTWQVRIVRNRYADSVRLMAIAKDLRSRPQVAACEVAMGTAANLAALRALGARADDATPADVVLAVDAADDAAATVLDEAEAALAAAVSAPGGGAERPPPRTIADAAARLDGANVALISVPGEYAALEAHHALACGMHVFLFSDHVAEADEIALKRAAGERGLLVMGPGCGTAMLGGVGLGFANVVRRGPVGIVAAAGTGAQEAACLLDAAGVGVSHIIGVGGRDLSAAIGGAAFRQGMRLLAADDETETLLLVSKPPAPAVVAGLAEAVPAGKRVVAAFVGWGGGPAPFAVHPTLEQGALGAAGAGAPDVAGLREVVDAGAAEARGRRVLGLYSGGSLAHEAVTVLEPVLGPIAGNVGHGGEGRDGHVVLDLGEEEYTQGRPHPMVDLTVRRAKLAEAAADERVGCVLLDVVLGHGAHPDPASELAEPVAALVGRRALVLARVCGTPADPQDSDRQAQTMRAAGAVVAPSNAALARLAARAVAGAP
jgi:FdrA protein